MIFQGAFQPLTFCGSMINYNSNSAGLYNKTVWLLQIEIKFCSTLTIKSLMLLSLPLGYALVLKQSGGI